MKIRIRFASEIYIEGNTMKDIEEEWESTSLFTKEALDKGTNFIEVESFEKV